MTKNKKWFWFQKRLLWEKLTGKRKPYSLLTEYDEKQHMKTVYREGYEAGQQRYIQEKIVRKLKKGKTPEQIAEELEEDIETIQDFLKK